MSTKNYILKYLSTLAMLICLMLSASAQIYYVTLTGTTTNTTSSSGVMTIPGLFTNQPFTIVNSNNVFLGDPLSTAFNKVNLDFAFLWNFDLTNIPASVLSLGSPTLGSNGLAAAMWVGIDEYGDVTTNPVPTGGGTNGYTGTNTWLIGGNKITSTNQASLGTTNDTGINIIQNGATVLQLQQGMSRSWHFILGNTNNFIPVDDSFHDDGVGIIGGDWNTVYDFPGKSMVDEYIWGGSFNSIYTGNNGTNLAILGSEHSAITNGSIYVTMWDDVILGGSNVVIQSASEVTALGQNVYVGTNNNTLVWSDGSITNFGPATNNSAAFNAINGFGFNTNSAGTNAVRVGGNVDALGFTVQGQPLLTGLAAWNNPVITTITTNIYGEPFGGYFILGGAGVTNVNGRWNFVTNGFLMGQVAFTNANGMATAVWGWDVWVLGQCVAVNYTGSNCIPVDFPLSAIQNANVSLFLLTTNLLMYVSQGDAATACTTWGTFPPLSYYPPAPTNIFCNVTFGMVTNYTTNSFLLYPSPILTNAAFTLGAYDAGGTTILQTNVLFSYVSPVTQPVQVGASFTIRDNANSQSGNGVTMYASWVDESGTTNTFPFVLAYWQYLQGPATIAPGWRDLEPFDMVTAAQGTPITVYSVCQLLNSGEYWTYDVSAYIRKNYP